MDGSKNINQIEDGIKINAKCRYEFRRGDRKTNHQLLIEVSESRRNKVRGSVWRTSIHVLIKYMTFHIQEIRIKIGQTKNFIFHGKIIELKR